MEKGACALELELEKRRRGGAEDLLAAEQKNTGRRFRDRRRTLPSEAKQILQTSGRKRENVKPVSGTAHTPQSTSTQPSAE